MNPSRTAASDLSPYHPRNKGRGMQAYRNTVTAIAVVTLVVIASVGRAEDSPRTKPLPVDVEKLFADAAKAEANGRYEDALRHYLRAFSVGRTDPETRDHIRLCLRHVAQAERHRDPVFQKFVAAMPTSDAITLYGEVIGEIHKKYADQTKAAIERLFAAGVDELNAALNESVFREQHLAGVDDAKVTEFRALVRDMKLPATPRDATQAARAVVAAANKTLGLKSGAAVVFELLSGACTGLDEYSSYVPPGMSETRPLNELAGYGLVVKADGQGLVVDAVQPRSWAAMMTKLRKGDRIRKVNGKAVSGKDGLGEALRAGDPHGHLIEFTPADDGVSSIMLPLPTPTVFGAELVDLKEGIGYLRLAAFKDRTPQEFDDAILELKARGMKALVIDIRGNAGGLFASAVGIANRLLAGGPVATTNGQTPEFSSRVFSSDSGMAAHDFPVVVLVDTKTMSAAEILAASLKDNQRATLIGLPTFGKGLIQAGIRLHSLDGTTDDRGTKSGLLILSVATASGPLSGLIQGRGVTPHMIEADAERQLTLAVDKAMELLADRRGLSPGPMSSELMPPMPPLDRR